MAHPEHDNVRLRYDSRCGYCNVADHDAGGEFTVDHFIPTAIGGGDAEDNLVYCCFRCNLFKSDFFAGEVDRNAGHVILHPIRDDVALHITLNHATGILEALTETGRFHMTLLHLNRPQLVTYRLRKRLSELLAAQHQLLQDENRELRTILATQQMYIDRLRDLLGERPLGS